MGVLWLTLAAFAIGTESYVIAGLLPIISADMQISVPAGGQLVTIYALTYALVSPILAVAFINLDRRNLLILALCGFVAGNLLAVVAGSFPVLLLSRVLMALGAGLYMPMAISLAVSIASPERRGRAAALVTSGIAVATVLGVPLGTLIGDKYGWRATFASVAVLGAFALVSLSFGLPRGLPRSTATLGQRLAVARHGAVLHALATTALWATACLTVYTYLSIPLRGLGFSASDVSLALLVFGSAAAIGNMAGGALSDRIGHVATAGLGLLGLTLALVLQSVALKFAAPEPARYLMLLLLFCSGIGAWAFFPAQIANIVRLEPEVSMIALSLNASAMYLGFAMGGAAGGIVLAVLDPSDLGWVGGCSAAAALALLLLRGWQEQPKLQKIAG